MFCHNDLLCGNIMLDAISVAQMESSNGPAADHDDEALRGACFIDYEYSCYNARAFDVANHFCGTCSIIAIF